MPTRVVAVRLKIPDNEAATALATLRRLGVALAGLERAEIVWLAPGQEAEFNPNKHAVTELESAHPREGETWIEETGRPGRAIAWRLFGNDGRPVAHDVVEFAANLLLCNPAIEKARYAP